MKTLQLTDEQIDLISKALCIAERTNVNKYVEALHSGQEMTEALQFYKDAEQFSELDSLLCLGEFYVTF